MFCVADMVMLHLCVADRGICHFSAADRVIHHFGVTDRGICHKYLLQQIGDYVISVWRIWELVISV